MCVCVCARACVYVSFLILMLCHLNSSHCADCSTNTGYLFGHKAETQGGSSGCPVLKEYKNEWVLVGVHRGTMPDKSGNPIINFATHVEAVFHTMRGKPNPLGGRHDGKGVAYSHTLPVCVYACV